MLCNNLLLYFSSRLHSDWRLAFDIDFRSCLRARAGFWNLDSRLRLKLEQHSWGYCLLLLLKGYLALREKKYYLIPSTRTVIFTLFNYRSLTSDDHILELLPVTPAPQWHNPQDLYIPLDYVRCHPYWAQISCS
jgi:hypothetical protein